MESKQKPIGDQRVELIAEVSSNHMGDMSLAKEMIVAAATHGADYVKFQTWSAESLKPGPWDIDGRREIYEKAELSNDDYAELMECCKENDVKFLTSCFKESDLDFIRKLSNEVKVPSTECNNINMVTKALKSFDRVFISTGATTLEEYSRWAEYDNAFLFHCVSCYPCPADKVNLPKLIRISEITPRFGYSGHFMGVDDAIAAATLGATIIEKHFTIDRNLPFRDNKFALLPNDLQNLRNYVDNLSEMMKGHGSDYQKEEQEARDVYSGRWDK